MHFSAELSETFRHQCETLRHQTHNAEMSWVRSVLGPKCPYTFRTSLELFMNVTVPKRNKKIRYIEQRETKLIWDNTDSHYNNNLYNFAG